VVHGQADAVNNRVTTTVSSFVYFY
jgi:hypothetical protein